MTNPTSPGPRRSRHKPNFWLRATPVQRVGVVAAALVLPCCGGVAVIGSLTAGKRPVVTTAPAALPAAPAAERLTGDRSAPDATPSHRPARPATTRRKITKRTSVAYPTRRMRDRTLDKGHTRVRIKGVTGVRTTTYEIVLAGGEEVSRKVLRSVVTRQPVTEVVAVGTRVAPVGDRCDGDDPACEEQTAVPFRIG